MKSNRTWPTYGNPCTGGGSAPSILLLLLFTLCSLKLPTMAQSPPTSSTNSVPTVFDQLITIGRAALKKGQLDVTLRSAIAAIKEDKKRFEGYALAGMACQKKGEMGRAGEYFGRAIERAPEAKKVQLVLMKQDLSNTNMTQAAAMKQSLSGSNASVSGRPSAPSGPLSSEAKVELQTLYLIAQGADKKDVPGEEHQRYLSEYLDKSAEFLKTNPDYLPVWIVRAAMALELGWSHESWEAGKNLKRLTAGKSELPQATELLAMLERKGWVGSAPPNAKPDLDKELTSGNQTTKDQNLAELLRRYRADEITPLEYHTQRAKIIAQQ